MRTFVELLVAAVCIAIALYLVWLGAHGMWDAAFAGRTNGLWTAIACAAGALIAYRTADRHLLSHAIVGY